MLDVDGRYPVVAAVNIGKLSACVGQPVRPAASEDVCWRGEVGGGPSVVIGDEVQRIGIDVEEV